MKRKISKFFKPMTAEQLKRNDRFFVLIVLVSTVFLLYSLIESAYRDIPQIGWLGYLAGPIFTHKLSEILLLIMWLPVAWVSNYENAGIWPNRLSAPRYTKLLHVLLIIAPWQIILGTYAWTIVNLGTSPLTTDYTPLVLGEDWFVWRYYLGGVVVAGALFIPTAVRKLVHLAQRGVEDDA